MSEAAAQSPAPPLRQAADRLREAARWLVVTFGAVAAVVFAGISISRFGDLDPDTAPGLFALAAVGALLALAGALGAMLVAMSLAAASTVSVADLRAEEPDAETRAALDALAYDPLLAPWEHSPRAFFDAVEKAQTNYQNELSAWAQSTDEEFGSHLVRRTSTRVEALSKIQGVLLENVSYLRLQRRFQLARVRLAVWLLLAAGGAAAYVWATGPAATEHVPSEVSAGTWAVSAARQDEIAERLGVDCEHELTAVPVTILDEEVGAAEIDIVTAADDGCQPLRLVVTAQELTGSG